MNGMQAVRLGDWKAIRKGLHKDPDAPIELYDLAEDISESRDFADQHPALISKAKEYMDRRESAIIADWNFIKPSPKQ